MTMKLRIKGFIILLLLFIILSFSASAVEVVDYGTLNVIHSIYVNDVPGTAYYNCTLNTSSFPSGDINFSIYASNLHDQLYLEQIIPENIGLVNASLSANYSMLTKGYYRVDSSILDGSGYYSGSLLAIFDVTGFKYNRDLTKDLMLLVDIDEHSSSFEIDGVAVIVLEDMMNPLTAVFWDGVSWVMDNSLINGMVSPTSVSYFKIEGVDYVYDPIAGVLTYDGVQWIPASDYNLGLPSGVYDSSVIILGDELVFIGLSANPVSETMAYYLDEPTHSWIRNDSYLTGSDLELANIIDTQITTFLDDGIPKMILSNFFASAESINYLSWNGTEWVDDYYKQYFDLNRFSFMFGGFEPVNLGDGKVTIMSIHSQDEPLPKAFDGGVASSNDYSFPVAPVVPAPSNGGGSSSGVSVSSSSSSRSEVLDGVPLTDDDNKKIFFLLLVSLAVFFYYNSSKKGTKSKGGKKRR